MAKKASKTKVSVFAGTQTAPATPPAPNTGKVMGKNGQYFTPAKGVSEYVCSFVTYTDEEITAERNKIPSVKVEGLDQMTPEQRKRLDTATVKWTEIAYMADHPWMDQEVYWLLLMFKKEERIWFVQSVLEKLDQKGFDHFMTVYQEAIKDLVMYWMVHWITLDFTRKDYQRQYLETMLPIMKDEAPFQYGDMLSVLSRAEIEEHLKVVAQFPDAKSVCLALAHNATLDADLREQLVLIDGHEPDAQKLIWSEILSTDQGKAAFMLMYPEFRADK